MASSWINRARQDGCGADIGGRNHHGACVPIAPATIFQDAAQMMVRNWVSPPACQWKILGDTDRRILYGREQIGN